ncbi:hypothetical protein [uncultured Desulfuromonas sp.]|uniref:hypothetical protein n=1 Tax=uncultured Desulfuromonas sp. TaxID=181013 RepID=UPI002AABC665|nr:hypothetical protein [uncultured Desulfuromonas sp.]
MGETLQYFSLSQVRITLVPFHRKYPVWMFRFSFPDSFDEKFEIYTSIFGNIEMTNPRDIEHRLREFEKIVPHPYSKEAIEQARLEQIESKRKAYEKGLMLFEESSFKNAFKKHFLISEIEAPENSSTYGVYFFTLPEWQASLSPQKSYPIPFEVKAVFPIKNNRIEASITPEEIEKAIDKCLSHPHVLNYISNNPTPGIRLRITGDRLHWNTPELQEFLSELKGSRAEEKEIRNWARVIIDGKEHQYFSFYLNSISGELIYTDTAANGSKPLLVTMEATN